MNNKNRLFQLFINRAILICFIFITACQSESILTDKGTTTLNSSHDLPNNHHFFTGSKIILTMYQEDKARPSLIKSAMDEVATQPNIPKSPDPTAKPCLVAGAKCSPSLLASLSQAGTKDTQAAAGNQKSLGTKLADIATDLIPGVPIIKALIDPTPKNGVKALASGIGLANPIAGATVGLLGLVVVGKEKIPLANGGHYYKHESLTGDIIYDVRDENNNELGQAVFTKGQDGKFTGEYFDYKFVDLSDEDPMNSCRNTYGCVPPLGSFGNPIGKEINWEDGTAIPLNPAGDNNGRDSSVIPLSSQSTPRETDPNGEKIASTPTDSGVRTVGNWPPENSQTPKPTGNGVRTVDSWPPENYQPKQPEVEVADNSLLSEDGGVQLKLDTGPLSMVQSMDDEKQAGISVCQTITGYFLTPRIVVYTNPSKDNCTNRKVRIKAYVPDNQKTFWIYKQNEIEIMQTMTTVFLDDGVLTVMAITMFTENLTTQNVKLLPLTDDIPNMQGNNILETIIKRTSALYPGVASEIASQQCKLWKQRGLNNSQKICSLSTEHE